MCSALSTGCALALNAAATDMAAPTPAATTTVAGATAAAAAASLSWHPGFSRTRFLVMDEADRLLDPSFEDDLRVVLSLLPDKDRQTLLFSATLTNSLIKLQKATLKDAHVFQVGL